MSYQLDEDGDREERRWRIYVLEGALAERFNLRRAGLFADNNRFRIMEEPYHGFMINLIGNRYIRVLINEERALHVLVKSGHVEEFRRWLMDQVGSSSTNDYGYVYLTL